MMLYDLVYRSSDTTGPIRMVDPVMDDFNISTLVISTYSVV